MSSIHDYAEELANELMGNWRKFESFGWHDRPEDAERWAIVYTHNRDSGMMALSNASVYEAALEASEFENDVQREHHGHWACGWVGGYAIRVRDDMLQLTPAWLKYCELHIAEAEYPLLDESDYSQREYDAAIKAIEQELYALDKKDPELPGEVFGWLWEHDQSELENRDDQGASPSRATVAKAVRALRPVFTVADVGCWADGAHGHAHIRETMARLLEENYTDNGQNAIIEELRAEMSDDASEELDALELLNELCSDEVIVEMVDGDLMVSAFEGEDET